MAEFPTSVYSPLNPTDSNTLANLPHAELHQSHEAEIAATQTKIGTGSSTPSSGKVLRATGSGASAWGAADLTTDVTGTLPVANGGTGTTTSTGSGSNVLGMSPTISGTVAGAATYTSPTLTTPTIASFTNAQHDHTNAAGGGQLGTNAITSGAVTPGKLSSAFSSTSNTASVATQQTTTSTSYADLATTGPTVTITTGTAVLVFVHALSWNSVAGDTFMSFAVSGASTVAASDQFARSVNGTGGIMCSGAFLVTGLTAGSNTFTAKYKTSANTANFMNRKLTVIPIN